MNELPNRASTSAESVGRYVLYPPIARGGMASVHAARLVGAEGFSRLVAAKRLHPHFSEDPDFLAMFHDEARIASRIHHPNVVPVLDVVLTERDTVLVQEFVHGAPLSYLMKVANATASPIAVPIIVAVVAGVLAGLHAAHEARDELERPLGIIHRDVSPQNVMVSVDGVPRLLDFGIAKARTSAHHTREGIFKGKLAYVAPEQIRLEPLTRRVDIYAIGVVMWELLTNRRFNDGKGDAEFVASLVDGSIPSVAEVYSPSRGTMSDGQWSKLLALSAVVSRARAFATEDRFATAGEMLSAILAAHDPAPAHDVAEWVRSIAGDYIDKQQKELALNEENWHSLSQVAVADSPSARMLVDTTPTATAGSEISSMQRSPSSLSPLERAEALVVPKKVLPWAATMGFALVLAVLLGTLLGTSRPPTPPAAAQMPVVETAAPPRPETATLTPTNRSPAPSAVAPSPVVAAVPVPTVVAPVFTGVPFRAAPSRAVTFRPAPAPSTVASAPVDCNPPFYFEGTKKLFKRSCL